MINMLSFFLTKKDILLGYESLNLGMLKNPLYSLCLGEVAIRIFQPFHKSGVNENVPGNTILAIILLQVLTV
jgi:hypothetical protein